MALSAPTSAVDICNLAVSLTGNGVVTSIDPPVSSAEKALNKWYHPTRRQILRGHPWNFAKSRKAIALNAVEPAFGYSDAYDLPNDFLRLLFVGDDSTGSYIRDYEIEGTQIFINNSTAATLNIGYIKDATTVSKFDALFVALFAVHLALNTSYAFTLKPSLVKLLNERAIELSIEAKAIDGQERPPTRIQTSKFSNARRSVMANVASPYTLIR